MGRERYARTPVTDRLVRGVLGALLALTLLAVAACGDDERDDEGPTDADAGRGGLEISSPDWADDEPIPVRFTCDGAGETPSFRWRGVPAEAEELALTIVDPDAPQGSFSHWGIAGIDPAAGQVGPGQLAGGTEVENENGARVYVPPCPPMNSAIPHTYVVTVFAFEEQAELDGDPTVAELNDAASEVAIAQDTLTASYER